MSKIELRLLLKPNLVVQNNNFRNYINYWQGDSSTQMDGQSLSDYTGRTTYTNLDGWTHGGTNMPSAYLRSNSGSTAKAWQVLCGTTLTDCFYKIEFDILNTTGGSLVPIFNGVTGSTNPSGPASVTTIVPTFNLIGIDSGCTIINTGGNVLSDGGSTVTSRGVVWALTTNPTTADNILLSGSGIGTFISSISGISLWNFTTYYVRAFATNSITTQYGNLVSIKTLKPDGGGPCDTIEYTIDGGEPCTIYIGCGIDGGTP
jgi:hypothetical protein